MVAGAMVETASLSLKSGAAAPHDATQEQARPTREAPPEEAEEEPER